MIAEALLSQTPVLMGVSRTNLDACVAFAGDAFVGLEADEDAVLQWCRDVMRDLETA